MEYLLTQKEFDALTPVKRLQDRNEALEVAKDLILNMHGKGCLEMIGDCGSCPIGKLGLSSDKNKHEASKHICIIKRGYSK